MKQTNSLIRASYLIVKTPVCTIANLAPKSCELLSRVCEDGLLHADASLTRWERDNGIDHSQSYEENLKNLIQKMDQEDKKTDSKEKEKEEMKEKMKTIIEAIKEIQ